MSKSHIGDTKLKILSIIWYISTHGENAYGYRIWKMLTKFHNTLDLRNVYHHLNELERMTLIKRKMAIKTKTAPPQKVYELTSEGENVVTKYCDMYVSWLSRVEKYDKEKDISVSVNRVNGNDEPGAFSPSLQRLPS
jgi:DNA-binding PadR family transcriptional regulator